MRKLELNKTSLIAFAAFALMFIAIGFFIAKGKYDKPLDVGVEIDTIIVYDTVPYINPEPKDSTFIKYVTKWLPVVKHDTTENYIFDWLHDTVAVEVPITSKHYQADEYDAYISGFEPNLDSIFVRQKTEYVTKTVTISKPPNKWELDVVGGIEYGITSKEFQPFAGGELLLNNHKRVKFGLGGGVKKNEFTKDFDPYVEVEAKIKVF